MYTHTLFARFLNPLGCLRCRSTCRIAILSMGHGNRSRPSLIFSTYSTYTSDLPAPSCSRRSISHHDPTLNIYGIVSTIIKYFNTNRSEIDQRLSSHDGYSSQVLDAVLQPLNKCLATEKLHVEKWLSNVTRNVDTWIVDDTNESTMGARCLGAKTNQLTYTRCKIIEYKCVISFPYRI